MSYAINLVGKKFGKLTVLKRDESQIYKNRKYRAIWICKCECGGISSVRSHSLRTGLTKSCGCLNLQILPGSKNSHFKGYKEISLTFWNRIKNRANKSGILMNLSIEEGWKLFEKQKHKCALSGELIEFGSVQSKKIDKGTASLDRIDSNKGYIKGNVQWVHKDINLMKNSLNQNQFLKWCKLISNYNEQ